ncbi:MAG TPA: SGNH/GDSL hydrolase family protein, partial [Verrucomicrobiae bacterium]|nr:SGNH/GDSL hydrolase family protein [Verrucomicrobiae bacterium]
MNYTTFKKPVAALLLASVAACGGGAPAAGTGGLPAAPLARRAGAAHPHAALTNVVGVGDSLTAGYQAGGFLGALGVNNPLDTFPPNNVVPPGQESGWFADLYEQATGFPPGEMYDPSVSPLPLIAGPGLDNQIVASASTVIGQLKSGDACTDNNDFNLDGFSLSHLARVRLNPNSPNIRDLGVPGITLHEAIYMRAPLTSTCQSIPGVPGLLSEVINDESGLFYPVLGGFAGQIAPSRFSMVNIAHDLRPQLVTVWLGANDVLKFMGSGGAFTAGDNTVGQVSNDISGVLKTVTANGALAIVANLPDVLQAPYFMNINIPKNANACKIRQYFYCFLQDFGLSPTQAEGVTLTVGKTYGLIPPAGKCVATSTNSPCGYVVLPGALAILSSLEATGKIPNLDPNGPGSGLGASYITPAFATRVQNLNNVVNEGIAQGAQSRGVPMVDVRTIFAGLVSGDPHNPYFQLAQVNPGVCCYAAYLGGTLSFDGIHPSNTGYAIIAYEFIATLNAKYNLHIPEVPIQKIYAGLP